jgi:hypothetical protein
METYIFKKARSPSLSKVYNKGNDFAEIRGAHDRGR